MTINEMNAVVAAVQSTDNPDDLRRAFVERGIGNHRKTNLYYTYAESTASSKKQIPSDYFYAVVATAEYLGMVIADDARPDISWSWSAKWPITKKAKSNQEKAVDLITAAIKYIRARAL